MTLLSALLSLILGIVAACVPAVPSGASYEPMTPNAFASSRERPAEPGDDGVGVRSGGSASMPAQDASAVTFEGLATWFPSEGYQGAVPWWKPGQDPLVVAVSAFRDGRTYSTSVLVTGWCACGDRDGLPTVIDLSPRAFAELAPLSVGVVSVQVELPAQGPVLPATSTK